MIIVLNNKCNLDREQFIEYIDEISKLNTNLEMILCPTTININELYNNKPDKIKIGSQNVSSTGQGSYTGEISSKQLKSYGVEYCIVGHSERRENQKETLEEINKKIKELLEYNIKPILCVGETLEERKNNKIKEVLEDEITSAIKGLSVEEKKKIIIAYEPIWSIGTGLIPTNDQIYFTISYIKKILPNVKVLYGGSVNEENIDIIKNNNQIDGFLLGGLSIKLDKLQKFLDKLN